MAAINTAIQLQDKMSGTLNRITASIYSTVSAFQKVDAATDQAFNTAPISAMAQEIYGYMQRIDQLEADLVDANKRIKQMEEATEKAKKEADKLQKAFGMVGGAIAALGIGHIVKEQVAQAVDYASDLTEVQNVVDTVFGDNSAVNEWAKNTLNAVGLNELTAKQFAGTMGAMLSSSGITGESIEDMSTSLTELAGNMASFYNLDAAEAFTKIRSGISGETEPLKQLGINMSVANLEAYALAQGIKKSYDEMSQAEQVALRYGYLMNATKNAQGDFAKTSTSYANQVKLLKENWLGFTGALATNGIPVLALGIGLLNSAVEFISDNWSIISPIFTGILTFLGLYAAALLIGKTIQLASAAATAIHTAMTSAWSAATFMQTVQQNGLNAAMLACPITWIIAGIVAIIAVIALVCSWIAKSSEAVDSAIGVIAGSISWLVGLVVDVFHGILTFLYGIFTELYNLFAKFANFIGNFLRNPVAAIEHLFVDLFDTVLGVVESIAGLVDSILGTDWSSSVAGFRDRLQATADEMLGEQKVYVEELTQAEVLATLPFERWDLTDTFDKGAAWGDGVAEKMSGAFNTEDLLGGTNLDAYSAGNDDLELSLIDEINKGTWATAEKTDISNENLEYIRDSAEQEAINKFTTAEIKLDMVNNNSIASSMDIDGIVTQLSEGLREAMESAAEGVYA